MMRKPWGVYYPMFAKNRRKPRRRYRGYWEPFPMKGDNLSHLYKRRWALRGRLFNTSPIWHSGRNVEWRVLRWV